MSENDKGKGGDDPRLNLNKQLKKCPHCGSAPQKDIVYCQSCDIAYQQGCGARYKILDNGAIEKFCDVKRSRSPVNRVDSEILRRYENVQIIRGSANEDSIEALQTEMENGDERVKAVEKKIEEVRKQLGPDQKLRNEMDLVQGMKQRQRRSRNVILFQLTESDKENPKDWIADDLQRLCS